MEAPSFYRSALSRPSSALSSRRPFSARVASQGCDDRLIPSRPGSAREKCEVPSDVRRLQAKLERDNMLLRESINRDRQAWEKELRDAKDAHMVEISKQAELFEKSRVALMSSHGEAKAVLLVKSEVEDKAAKAKAEVQSEHELAMNSLRQMFDKEQSATKLELQNEYHEMSRTSRVRLQELQALVQELELKRDQDQTALRESSRHMQEVEEDRGNLRQQLTDVQSQMQSQTDSVLEMSGDVTRLEHRVQELKFQVKDAESGRNEDRRTSSVKATEDLSALLNLREDLKNARLLLQNKERELAALHDELANVRLQLQNKDEQVLGLQSHLEEEQRLLRQKVEAICAQKDTQLANLEEGKRRLSCSLSDAMEKLAAQKAVQPAPAPVQPLSWNAQRDHSQMAGVGVEKSALLAKMNEEQHILCEEMAKMKKEHRLVCEEKVIVQLQLQHKSEETDGLQLQLVGKNDEAKALKLQVRDMERCMKEEVNAQKVFTAKMATVEEDRRQLREQMEKAQLELKSKCDEAARLQSLVQQCKFQLQEVGVRRETELRALQEIHSSQLAKSELEWTSWKKVHADLQHQLASVLVEQQSKNDKIKNQNDELAKLKKTMEALEREVWEYENRSKVSKVMGAFWEKPVTKPKK